MPVRSDTDALTGVAEKFRKCCHESTRLERAEDQGDVKSRY